ncbi:hypothetical protein D9M69_456120 [compost metagenome]
MRQARPVFVQQAAGTQPVLVQPADRAQHTHGQLRARHFHREHCHRQALLHRHVLADVQRERGLTHRRAAGHDDQVAALHAAGHPVQVHEARGHAGHVAGAVAMVKLVDALDHLRQQRLDFLETLLATRAFLGDRKDLGLGFVQQLADFPPLGREGCRGDVVGDGDQLAQHRAFAHDFRVAADIGCAGRVLCQRIQVCQPADFLGLARNLQHFVDRDHVGRLGGRDQPGDALEDHPVVEAVEIRLRKEVRNAVPGGVVQQQATEYRLLGFNGMRRNLEVVELGVGDGRVHGEGL